MADVTSLTQIAQDSDRVMAGWINAVNAKFKELAENIAYTSQQLTSLQSQLAQAFRVTPTAGLSANVAGGSVKIEGAVVAINPTPITLPNNATSFVFINNAGQIVTATTRPTLGYEIARVVTANGAIASVQQFPIFEVRLSNINLDNYATVDYANSRMWVNQASAKKGSDFLIPTIDTYYTIPFEQLKGTGFNTAGIFTAPQAGQYIFNCQVRLTTTAVQTSPNMAAKLSLFSSGQEVAILSQVESARGDLSMNAENVEPLTMAINQQAQIRIYLTEGKQTSVRENSVIQVWRLPP